METEISKKEGSRMLSEDEKAKKKIDKGLEMINCDNADDLAKIKEFALDFLLPNCELKKIVDLDNLSTSLIKEVAEKFVVSPQIAATRLKSYVRIEQKELF